jgi:hypothetical protein
MAFPYIRANADWKNAATATGGGDTSTPINEAALDTIEAGVKSLSDILALVDAKGDLIVGTANDTHARKAVGSNDEVLVADSAQATGVKWSKVGNAQVATGAAIDVAKLAAGADESVLKTVSGAPAWAGAATSYTPTWGVLSGSAPSLGNGTLSGVYFRLGALLHIGISLTWGSTTSAAGTGIWTFSTPVNFTGVLGAAIAIDISAGARYPFMPVPSASAAFFLMNFAGTGFISDGQPFVWANTDILQIDALFRL